MGPRHTLTLWTVQDFSRVAQLDVDGVLYGSAEHAMFPEPYKWMLEQMAQRLPAFSGNYPVWAWAKKPDMRSTRFEYEVEEWACRIAFEVPAERVLLSDFGPWHSVLNGMPHCTEAEWETWEQQGKSTTWLRSTWERIFDLDFWQRDPEWFGDPFIQACVDGLQKSEVLSVEWFRGGRRL